MKSNFYFLIILFVSEALSSFAQNEDYYNDKEFRFNNWIYDKNIRTVQVYRNGFKISDPIINLNTGEQLKLSFDDISAEIKTYNYTIMHCNSDWEQSKIFPQDYSTGFTDDVIRNYKYSFNTTQRYVHYEVNFPNENITITKSGNYLLKVYQDYDPEKVVITYRFIVVDNKLSITPQFKRPTKVADRNYKQEIDFNIDYSGVQIPNPFGDIKVVVLQNDRWDNAICNLKPVFVQDNLLIYDYDQDNVFNGNNEFREFDTRSLRFITTYVNKIEYDSTKHFNVFLLNDERRAFKRYIFKNDINGRYYIDVREGQTPETDADYAYVKFFYPCEKPFDEGDIYVFGQLSNWNYLPEYKMKYNVAAKCYMNSILLKQGYYNYEYSLLPKKSDEKSDDTFIEGNFFDTENEYTILVYYRQLGTNYEQLIGFTRFNTIKN